MKTIPSQLNKTSTVTAPQDRYLYITAILKDNGVSVDGVSLGNSHEVALHSPIRCKTFTTSSTGHIAYYISN
jgi:hypothetical protein